jgi:AraC-like DNA-binding protein
MLYYFALISIITSTLLAVYNWKLQKGALLISGILLILSTYALAHHYTDSSQSDFSLALVYGTLSPLWLLPGPFLFFYFRSVLTPTKVWVSWKDGIHFVPSIIHLINILPYIISPFFYKLQVAHSIHQNLNNIRIININYLYSFETAFLSRPIVLLFYLVWCALLFLRQFSRILVRTRIWLICFMFSLFLTTAVYLFISLKLFSTSLTSNVVDTYPLYVSSGIVYIFLPVALILFFPEVLFGIKRQEVDGILEKLDVSPNALTAHTDLAKKIKEYLRHEKPYLNPSFELSVVAKAVNVASKQVSFACKHVLKIKFTDLRAQLRVEHAKDLLRKGVTETLTIDAIGTNSGFKSRSAFYDAFKAETGMTPSQYLENLA